MLPILDSATSFGRVLAPLKSVFTRPTFETFCALALGMVCQIGERTVTGMLLGARLSTRWHHSRAHNFFSRSVWSLDELGLHVMALAQARLMEPGVVVRLAVDDTLFRRSGRKVAHAFFQHDGSGTGPGAVAFGNNFIVLGMLVDLKFMTRPVCLPILFRLYKKDGPSRAQLARDLVRIAATFLAPGRIELVGDAAYATHEFMQLPSRVSFTSRLRRNAALYRPAPPRTGRPGRPRTKGERLPPLDKLATDKRRRWRDVTVTRYGRVEQVQVITLVCLWYSVTGERPVRVVLIREPGSSKAFDFALIATDTDLGPGQVIELYAQRWAIEVAFRDAKQTTGVGDARNRTPRAVERTVPFGLLVQSLVTIWYALHGHTDAIVAARRLRAPWYLDKTEPSYLDMLTTLRSQITTEQYQATPHPLSDPQQMPDPASLLELLAS